MKKLFACLLLMVSCVANANADGIRFFEGSWDQALAEAKAQNKLLFVDLYAEWCGPCKIMEREVFPRADVGALYNQHFVNYQLDTEDESQRGPEISARYQVPGLPFFLYLNADGDVVHIGMGGMDPEQLIAEGNKAIANRNNF